MFLFIIITCEMEWCKDGFYCKSLSLLANLPLADLSITADLRGGWNTFTFISYTISAICVFFLIMKNNNENYFRNITYILGAPKVLGGPSFAQ